MKQFRVRITLLTTEKGRGARVFHKDIEAENEEQACDFVRQMLEGFLKDNVSVETKIEN